MKRVIALIISVITLGMTGVAYADGAHDGPQPKQPAYDCWIPVNDKPAPPAVVRILDDTWEVLMESGKAEIVDSGLCEEVLPGMYVWSGRAQVVRTFLHAMNGEVLFFGEWIPWSPMLPGMARIASCESSGNWKAWSANGVPGHFYGGLFQIDGLDPNTPPAEQVQAFYDKFDKQGWRAWYGCSKMFGFI